MAMLFLREPHTQQWGNKMVHHNKYQIIRIVLNSNCECDFCTHLMSTLCSDERIDNLQSTITKMKDLKQKEIIDNSNCLNDECKHIFD